VVEEHLSVWLSWSTLAFHVHTALTNFNFSRKLIITVENYRHFILLVCYSFSRIILLLKIIWVGAASRLPVTWLQALGNSISTISKDTEDMRLNLSSLVNSEML